MPLARIITDSVDDSLELTIQLRARGFQVETVAPSAVPNTPADLEVRLEECASEDALTRASETLTQDDLWVFVAPGALDERVRVIREIPIEPMAGLESKAVAPVRLTPPSVAPVLPFLTPEDDPILAELVELKRSGEEPAQPAPPAERSPERAEIVVFPAVGEPRVAASAGDRVSLAESGRVPGAAANREPGSSPNLRFWRIATVAAGLAIAALLVGANMSRQPNRPQAELVSVTTAQPASPSPIARVQPQARKASAPPALPAPIEAKGAAPTRQTLQVAKAVQTRAAKPRRRSTTSHADSIIAEDTVVFYDRKSSLPSGKGPEPGRKQSGRN